ncbi:MAG: SDR family NAD(P)-dependent oxidoreductase [Oligoflexus sp.]
MKMRSKMATGMAMLAAYQIGQHFISLRKQMNFKGKVVLITGGSRGLGLILARELGRQGAFVCICARQQDELIQAKNWLAREGVSSVIPYVCDVSNRQQVEDMIVAVKGQCGSIDILINNAGVISVAPFEHTTVADFEEVMNINFWGTLYPCLAVIEHMQEKDHGHIVNITSIGGMIGLPHMLPYSAAKFAAVGFSQGLHAELRKSGITVTTIVPGFMRTGSYVNAMVKGQKEKEFAWFAVGENLPGISMNAERAAKKIVSAIRQRKSMQIIGMPAKIAIFLNNNFSNLFTSLQCAVHDLLPVADASSSMTSFIKTKGEDLHSSERTTSMRVLTRLGREAVNRYQRYQA